MVVRHLTRPRRRAALVLLALAAYAPGAGAQPDPAQPPQVFTLAEALQYAVDHYPSVKAALEDVNAASAGVQVARAGYLPRLDTVWQSNRATANNIAGQLLPQSVIPSISGPVLPASNGASVWGSAAGALFSWEPMDFGLRAATVRQADAAVVGAQAIATITQLDVQQAVGAAFLDAAAAGQAAAAAEADVHRRDVLARAARALADNQLRPGADASRAEAERAAAETRAIRAREALTVAKLTLARVLGIRGDVSIDERSALGNPPRAVTPPPPAIRHPVTAAREAAVAAARAREDVLAHTDWPRVFVQSSVFGRGSGVDPDGPFAGGLQGLGLDRANWAAGVQVVFPNAFDFASLRARRAASAAETRAETARYDEAVLVVSSRQRAAAAMLAAAEAVAANTPVQLAAARQSESQARARYDAGLASVIEVADAQNLLAQAEYQDRLARIDVWRALLTQAIALGDIAAFTNLAPAAGARR